MRSTPDGIEMTLTDMALSAYRAWAYATGRDPDGDMDDADAQRWLRAAAWAKMSFAGLDGRPVSEGVDAFLKEWSGGDQQVLAEQAPYRTEWEAVVRHLNMILDSDDLRDEGDLRGWEASWAAWVQGRPRRVVEG